MFLENEIYITIQTHPTQIVLIVYFLEKTQFLLIFKDYWGTELITYDRLFVRILECNNISKVRYSTPTQKNI